MSINCKTTIFYFNLKLTVTERGVNTGELAAICPTDLRVAPNTTRRCLKKLK